MEIIDLTALSNMAGSKRAASEPLSSAPKRHLSLSIERKDLLKRYISDIVNARRRHRDSVAVQCAKGDSLREYPRRTNWYSEPLSGQDFIDIQRWAADRDSSSLRVAQTVTAIHKKPVLLSCYTVFKGPFKSTDVALCLAMERCDFFVGAGCKAFVPVKLYHYRNPNGDIDYYICSPNVGDVPEHTEHQRYLPRNHPAYESTFGDVIQRETQAEFTQYGCTRRERGGVSRASDELALRGNLSERDWKHLIYYFLLCYIKRVGDCGLWNVVNARGIDYHEVRKKETDATRPACLYDTLFSKKCKDDAYKPEIHRIMSKYRTYFYKRLFNRARMYMANDIAGMGRLTLLLYFLGTDKFT